MSYQEKSRQKDNIDRGNKGRDYAGFAAFFGGRLVEPAVQYGFLKLGWGSSFVKRLGGSTLPEGPSLITRTPLDRLGLSPYRTILFGMSCGAMLKQNYHLSAIMQEKMSFGSGLMVSAFNMAFNSLNSLFFVCAQTSASVNGEHFPQTPLIVGSTMYVTGLLIELLSEQQRHNWKKDPANKGQVYEGGLWSLSRHINYFGYTVWRTGYALAAGGWLWGATVASFFTFQFNTMAIPALQHYMEERYGEKFEHYKKTTPCKFVPWIY